MLAAKRDKLKHEHDKTNARHPLCEITGVIVACSEGHWMLNPSPSCKHLLTTIKDSKDG
jgi:hypothetical protein